MTPTLRIFLIVGAVLTLIYFIVQIRKKRLQIDYAIFWTLLCVFLVVISIIPWPVTWASELLGFEAPANLVFLVAIFLLIVRLFTLTTKLSQLDRKIAELTQKIAIYEKDTEA